MASPAMRPRTRIENAVIARTAISIQNGKVISLAFGYYEPRKMLRDRKRLQQQLRMPLACPKEHVKRSAILAHRSDHIM